MIKITKKAALPRNREILIQALAIVFALVFAGLVIAVIGFNPLLVLIPFIQRH